MLGNWRENYSDRQLEKKYRQSFLADLQSDHHLLDSVLVSQENSRKQISRLFQQIGATKIDQDSILILMSPILAYEPFFPSVNTYESMRNSGNMGLISDFNLQQDLVTYYHLLEEKKLVEEIYFNFINSYLTPFLMKHFDTSNQKFMDPAVLRTTEFLNLIGGSRQLLEQIHTFYQKLEQRNRDLISRLQKSE